MLGRIAAAAVVLLSAACAAPEPKPSQPTQIVVVPSPASSDEPIAPAPARSETAVPRNVDRRSGSADDRALAEKYFQEARQLLNQGELERACARFEQSLDADPALGSLLNLASCQERLAHKAVACELYAQALEWATRDKQDDRARFVRDRLMGLGC